MAKALQDKNSPKWALDTIAANERGENVDCDAQDDGGLSPLVEALYFGDVYIDRVLPIGAANMTPICR